MLKDIFYNWFGFNNYIFLLLNDYFGSKKYNTFWLLIDQFVHTPFFVGCIFCFLLGAKFTKKNKLIWIYSLVTYMLSITIVEWIFAIAKHYFYMPRPFCNEELNSIYVLSMIADNVHCHHSFPSGHASIATVLVLTIWSVSYRSIKWLSICFLAVISISRLAIGVHYPADILGGILIASFITISLHKIVIFMLDE